MSGYLNRLIRRTQAANESQFLRPFVRSMSPSAEHDQRLGVPGFEDAENSISTLADAGTDQDLGEAGEVQVLKVPEVTASSNVTVQRKVAASATPVAPIASNASPVNMLGTSDISSVKVRADRGSPPEFLGEERPEPFIPSSSESGISVQRDRHQGSIASPSLPMTGESRRQPEGRERVRQLHPAVRQRQPRQMSEMPERSAIPIETSVVADTPQPTATLENTNAVADTQPPAAATVRTPIAVPSLGRAKTREVEQQSTSLDDARPRRILQERQSDVPSLEPSMGSLANRDELRFEDATVLNIDRKESPRVAIGRIDVEVIPQTATEATVATSRSGPLTAESVSVIGPLGGGVSSNLRFSLRQR